MKQEMQGIQGHKISLKAITGWVFIVISLFMLGNSIRLCFSQDIWYDELFTIGMIEHSYGELIHFTAQDVHPPLYYCITKLIVDLCKLIIPSANTIMIAKAVSVLPYFLLLVYALCFLRTRFGIFTAGLFSFCILSMPQMSAYTVEVRMYGFTLLFVTAAFFHAYDIIRNDNYKFRNYVALTIYGLAAAYTQYFACIAVIMIYCFLLLWFLTRCIRCRRVHLKSWFICVLVSIVCYLPWLVVLLSQITAVRKNYWILPLTWRSLGGCVKFLMKPAFYKEEINVVLAVVFFLLYIVILVYNGYRLWNCVQKSGGEKTAEKIKEMTVTEEAFQKYYYALAGCFVLCGLVGVGFIASIAIRPIFVYRYMLPAMGCFWFCFVLNMDMLLDGENIRVSYSRFRVLAAVFAVLLTAVIGLRDYTAFMGEEEYKIVLMKETEQAISDIASSDIIIYNFDQLQAVTGYYMNQDSYLWRGTPERLIVEMFGNKMIVEDTEQIQEWLREGRKVWFFGSFNSREDICSEWENEGLLTEEMGSYMLERYWFNIYSVSEK